MSCGHSSACTKCRDNQFAADVLLWAGLSLTAGAAVGVAMLAVIGAGDVLWSLVSWLWGLL